MKNKACWTDCLMCRPSVSGLELPDLFSAEWEWESNKKCYENENSNHHCFQLVCLEEYRRGLHHRSHMSTSQMLFFALITPFHTVGSCLVGEPELGCPRSAFLHFQPTQLNLVRPNWYWCISDTGYSLL